MFYKKYFLTYNRLQLLNKPALLKLLFAKPNEIPKLGLSLKIRPLNN